MYLLPKPSHERIFYRLETRSECRTKAVSQKNKVQLHSLLDLHERVVVQYPLVLSSNQHVRNYALGWSGPLFVSFRGWHRPAVHNWATRVGFA